MAFKRPSVQFCPPPPVILKAYSITLVSLFLFERFSHTWPHILSCSVSIVVDYRGSDRIISIHSLRVKSMEKTWSDASSDRI